MSNEVTAVVLREFSPNPAPFEVKARDGSVLQAKSLIVQGDTIVIYDQSLGGFRIALTDLMEIKRSAARGQGPKPN
jgi:hypothetical protein